MLGNDRSLLIVFLRLVTKSDCKMSLVSLATNYPDNRSDLYKTPILLDNKGAVLTKKKT